MHITEKHVQSWIMRWAMDWKNHELAIPNSREIVGWEADVLTWTKARYMHEFEVKLNIYDFRADFKKRWKHQELRRPLKANCPNYFWYVTVNFFVRPPEYAGWIYIEVLEGKGAFYIQKKAPLLHKKKLPEGYNSKLMRILAYRVKSMYHSRWTEESEMRYKEWPLKTRRNP